MEAILNVDERGQMVLPKSVRSALGVQGGGKLAAVAMSRDGETCCVTLIRADRLEGMVRGFLGPVISQAFGDGGSK